MPRLEQLKNLIKDKKLDSRTHLVLYFCFRLGVAFDRVGIVLQILWSGLLAIFGGRSVVVVAVLLLI